MKDFYKGKNVLVTGHTGFKGTWLCKMLLGMGANVTGYALDPPTNPNLYELSGVDEHIKSYIADIRDFEKLNSVFDENNFDIVFHLAAQPIVRDSYKMPHYTYETNVMGTVNICECVRLHSSVKSFVNITTDKVYENNDYEVEMVENMPLDGYDPYSNSKSCSELVTHSYKKSFFDDRDIGVSTVRAGNVIGGGDFANDRLIPDCVRAVMDKRNIVIRNPKSIRPFQHVLEPLYVYLLIAMEQYKDKSKQGYYNVGPNAVDCVSAGEVADIFCNEYGNGVKWVYQDEANAVHEANFLKLNTDKIKNTFNWQPVWNVKTAIKKVVEFVKVYENGENISAFMDSEIDEFFGDMNNA